MKRLLFVIQLVLYTKCLSTKRLRYSGLRAHFPDPVPMIRNGIDPGKPLFLTPYIEKGDIKTGQKLSKVGPLDGSHLDSYAGFLTVNKVYNSNMFFWFYPSQVKPESSPIMLWLQGGPGGTSMFGNFNENGPYGIDKDLKLFPRKFSWNTKYSMLYIDNPVGTGFSFTGSDAGYATNETDVAVNLYSALVQFFTLYPEYKECDFHLTGESYAGKYLPAIARYILHQEKPLITNLKGMAIGDGFSDPPTMIGGYADFLYQIGMLDELESQYFKNQTDIIKKLIDQKQYVQAFKQLNNINPGSKFFINSTGQLYSYNYMHTQQWDSLLNGDLSGKPSFFKNVTGSANYYNFLMSKAPDDFQYYGKYLAKPEVRKAIHVGNLTFNDGDKVEQHLQNDILQTITPWLAEVMENYKVMLYSGQLDIIVAAPLTERMLWNLQWKYQDEYKSCKKQVWKVRQSDTEVAGYVRHVQNFCQVIVRGAGHILPYDQPERALDMIDRFVTETPFSGHT